MKSIRSFVSTVRSRLVKRRRQLLGVAVGAATFAMLSSPASAQDISQEIAKVKAVTNLLKDVVTGITEVAILPLGIGAALQMYNRTLFRAI